MAEQDQQPQEVVRDSSAPVQQADAIPEYVDLIGLLADEFGISRGQARREMLMGSVQIDGEPYIHPQREQPGDPMFVMEREGVEGKTVEVRGGETDRIFRFQIQ